MRANRIKQAIAEGRKARGVHMTFAQPAAIEALALLELDFVYLDGEHGAFSPTDVEACCVAAERHGMTPIARIPEISHAAVCQLLDRGVSGLAVPHVDGIDDAKALIEAAYFAPLGQRSFGGGRPFFVRGIKDMKAHLAACNEAMSVGIMIESEGALREAGEIAALEGVDYMSFGMNDLAQALGHAGDPGHPQVASAVADATRRIRAAGKPVREDCMSFAWVNDILDVGARKLIDGEG